MSEQLTDQLKKTTARTIKSAVQSTLKAKGLIRNDTQFRSTYALVLEKMAKSDELLAQNKRDKVKKIEKEIARLSVELLDYERFRMVHK